MLTDRVNYTVFVSFLFWIFCCILSLMFVLKVAVEMKMRELIADDAFLDYVQPIPNPRHEKGKPGGGNNK